MFPVHNENTTASHYELDGLAVLARTLPRHRARLDRHPPDDAVLDHQASHPGPHCRGLAGDHSEQHRERSDQGLES